MSANDAFSFGIMNGECDVTSDAISFRHDEGWKWLERTFGKPSRRRSILLALVLGVPLICLSATCFAFGVWHLGTTPLLFGLILIVMVPISIMIGDDYVYPEHISRCDIQEVTATPPTRMRLSIFTITFLSDGNLHKTSFCLPCGNFREQRETFQTVSKALTVMGLLKQQNA